MKREHCSPSPFLFTKICPSFCDERSINIMRQNYHSVITQLLALHRQRLKLSLRLKMLAAQKQPRMLSVMSGLIILLLKSIMALTNLQLMLVVNLLAFQQRMEWAISSTESGNRPSLMAAIGHHKNQWAKMASYPYLSLGFIDQLEMTLGMKPRSKSTKKHRIY